MPTVFIQNGYRVSFYSYDLAERIHVHVFKSGSECKIWMDDLTIAFNRGFRAHDMRRSRVCYQSVAQKLSPNGRNMNERQIDV